MKKHFLPGLLAAALAAGCGSPEAGVTGSAGANSQNSGGGVQSLDPAASQALAKGLVDAAAPGFVVNPANLATQQFLTRADQISPRTGLDSQQVSASALALGLGVSQLGVIITGEAGSGNPVGIVITGEAGRVSSLVDITRTLNGPQGGTVQLTVVGNSITAVFQQFRSSSFTLNGTTRVEVTSGLLSSNQSAVNLSFTSMQVTDSTGTLTLDGTGQLTRQRTVNGPNVTLNSLLTLNLTATLPVGSVNLQNLVTNTTTTLTAGGAEATQTLNGTAVFQNVPAAGGLTLNGSSAVTTPTALHFTGTAQTLQIDGGVLLAAQSQGQLRLTVVAPNQVLVEVAPAGSNQFLTVNTLAWQALGGATNVI